MIDMRVRLPGEFRKATDKEMSDFYGKYDEILGVKAVKNKTTQSLLEELDTNHIDLAVVHAEYEFGENPVELNQHVSHLTNLYPNRLLGFGTVDLSTLQPMKLVRQAGTIKELGLKGINLQPAFFKVNPLDPKLYPLYATASQLGLVISFHTGIHFSLKHSIIDNNPMFIDQIAVDFPDLNIIACHGGWPWTPQMTAIARRHRQVFIEFGGLDPKYLGISGSGWETLLSMMNNLLSNQVIYGTDWPVMSSERAIRGWMKLGLKEDVLEKLFHTNAKKLLQL